MGQLHQENAEQESSNDSGIVGSAESTSERTASSQRTSKNRDRTMLDRTGSTLVSLRGTIGLSPNAEIDLSFVQAIAEDEQSSKSPWVWLSKAEAAPW
jgi:hypothetical protein